MTRLSVLDLAPIREGGDAAQAFGYTQALARRAEALGFYRYWFAEHHNMTGIGSAATAVLIGHVAGSTQRMRVGAGGVMLPNHTPLVVGEQFGTLEFLYPDWIDLGLGRAPGTDQRTVRALRRERSGGARGRAPGADLDPGIQRIERAVGRGVGSTLCIHVPLCAGSAYAGAGAVPEPVPPIGTTGAPVRNAVHQCPGGGYRW